MKYFIPMIILSLVLLSCSKEEEGETDTTTELEGTWKTACYTNSDNTTNIDTFIYAGNTWTIKDQRYSDTACATVYQLEEIPLTFSIGDAVTFANGKTGHKFTVTLGSTTKLTPQSDSAVSYFNTSRKCGVNGWVLDTAKECDIDEDEAEGISFAFMDAVEEIAKKSKENIATTQTLDYLLWCDPEKYDKSSKVYRKLKKIFSNFVEDEGVDATLRKINVNRKMILLKVDMD